MTSRTARLALLPLLACAALAACKSKPAKSGAVVAKVGDDTITADDFKKRLDEVSPFLRARYNTAEKKKEFLENLIKNELLAQEAQRRGLDKSQAVQDVVKRAMVQELLRTQLDEKLTGADLADADLKSFYDKHVDDYVKPERIRINHILLTGADAKAHGAKLLREISDREAKGEPGAFGAAAVKESQDKSSAPVSGDMRYMSKDELAKELGQNVADAAFALAKPGDKGGPIETPKGVELVRLQNRTVALDKKYEDVKEMIRQRMARERRTKDYEDFIKKLRDNGNVKIYDEEIAKLPNPEAAQGMPGMAGGFNAAPPQMMPRPMGQPPMVAPAGRVAQPTKAAAPR